MSLSNRIFGRPLANFERKKQALTIATGVPALGLDALASTAYGPEAALMVLLPAGVAGLYAFPYISIVIVCILVMLYLSYWQTVGAYPGGGGAYIVASKNLGVGAGLCAATALLVDYLLNVAVGISAGIGVVVSAIPALQPYKLTLCLIVLLVLTLINLRGVRESGLIFILPTIIFVAMMGMTLLMGSYHVWQTEGHPRALVPPPTLPPQIATISLWLLLGAFANGLTAMTGIEAVSNAVPLFRKPVVSNARWTLTLIMGVLGLFLLGLGYLCPAYQIIAMDESKQGYQTILSQLVAAVTGQGVFYYFSIASIFVVLTCSAQTSFIAFPRVCRLLAEDNYLPHFFAERGRRLVFSLGIIVLAAFAAILLVIFKGVTISLIPLFAVGAFSAFLFSQTGMVVHWLQRKRQRGAYIKLFLNGLGAVATFFALIAILLAKFMEGAWIVIIAALILIFLFSQINRHYRKISRSVDTPLALQVSRFQSPIVLIPFQGWNRVSEKAVRFGMLLSDDVTGIHVSTDSREERDKLIKLWAEKVQKPSVSAGLKKPGLAMINSKYRQFYKPILDFVNESKKKNPGRLIAVVIPELVEPHWYEALLHNIHAAGLRALLFMERDQRTVVITTPWYMH